MECYLLNTDAKSMTDGRSPHDKWFEYEMAFCAEDTWGISKHKDMIQSSSPGEFHPQALTDPDVTVSRHPALITPSPSSANLALSSGSSHHWLTKQ